MVTDEEKIIRESMRTIYISGITIGISVAVIAFNVVMVIWPPWRLP